MATERRYFGKVERVNTRPPSLTIIPEDLTIRPGYDVALGLSHTELADFLYTFATGQMRVSYVVQPGPAGVMLVQDVQSVEAVEVKEEPGSSGAAGGPGEVMMGEESGVSMTLGGAKCVDC